MEQLFNYRDIKQEHKEAAEEISNILSEVGHPELAVLIKQRFDVIEKNYFSPEFLNRIDEVVIFNPLKEDEIKKTPGASLIE